MNNFKSNEDFYCCYYQAEVLRPEAWFVTAILKSFDHLSLDRTINKELSLFEFFVPPAMEEHFLDLMRYFESQDLIKNLNKLPNRLADPTQKI